MRSRLAAAAAVVSLGLLQACCNTARTADYDPDSPAYYPATAVAGWEAGAVPAPAPAPAPSGLVPLERVGSTASSEEADLNELRLTNETLSERISRMKADVDALEKSRAGPPAAVAPPLATPFVAPVPAEPAAPRITVEAVREILTGASVRDLPVSMNAEGNVVITLPGSMAFAPGKAVLMNEGRGRLKAAATALVQSFPGISARAEAHTDSDPIRKSGWASNQALSEARAKAVADYLAQETPLAKGGVIHQGHGSTRPLASEETQAGKAQNRRVEIVLVP